MDGFARHILFGDKNLAPGAMGKRDMLIVMAIYHSIANGGQKVDLQLGDLGIV
jgi:glucose-fructose oxidoreductase